MYNFYKLRDALSEKEKDLLWLKSIELPRHSPIPYFASDQLECTARQDDAALVKYAQVSLENLPLYGSLTWTSVMEDHEVHSNCVMGGICRDMPIDDECLDTILLKVCSRYDHVHYIPSNATNYDIPEIASVFTVIHAMKTPRTWTIAIIEVITGEVYIYDPLQHYDSDCEEDEDTASISENRAAVVGETWTYVVPAIEIYRRR